MHYEFLVVTVKMAKIGYICEKLSQN